MKPGLLVFCLLLFVFASSGLERALAAEVVQSPEQLRAAPAISSEIIQQVGRLEARTKSAEDAIEKAVRKLDESQKTIQDIEKYLWVIVTLLGGSVVAVFGFGRDYVKRKLNTVVDGSRKSLELEHIKKLKELEVNLENKARGFEEKLIERTELTSKKTEETLFRYVQIASLRFSRQYDEALAFAGWQGDYASFKDYPEPIQLHLISCLANSRKAKDNRDHLKAWEWVRDLVAKTPSAENVEAMLRTANYLRYADDAIALYDSILDRLSLDKQAACEPFLIVILRKASDNPQALQLKSRMRKLTHKHRDSKDIRVKTTIAAVYREDGNFSDAGDIMKPAVKKSTGFTAQEEGWDKLFNTYIANCIDLGRPAEAIPQVKTILAQFRGPDHVFNCARVAWRLSPEDPAREEVFRLIRRRFDDGVMPEKDDGTIKTAAILFEVENRKEEAESVIQRSIDDLSNYDDRWARDQSYFFRCVLAEILIARADSGSIDRAIDVLEGDVNADKNGEATYLMAQAMLVKGNLPAVEKSLRAAANIKRKWIMKAKHDPAFSKFSALDDLVSNYVQPLS